MSGSVGNNPYRASGVVAAASGGGGITWQSVETGSTMTAEAGKGYPINTTSNACTVTLPAGSDGDQIQLVDYAGTFDTNPVTLTADGSEKIEGATDDLSLTGEREGVTLTYIDSTQGWLATSGINEGTDALVPPPYSIDFLVVAGGGGGGGCDHGAGGGAGGYRTLTESMATGVAITVSSWRWWCWWYKFTF